MLLSHLAARKMVQTLLEVENGPCMLTQLQVAATELDTNPSGTTLELRVHSFANAKYEGLFRFRVFAAAFGRLNCICCGLEL